MDHAVKHHKNCLVGESMKTEVRYLWKLQTQPWNHSCFWVLTASFSPPDTKFGYPGFTSHLRPVKLFSGCGICYKLTSVADSGNIAIQLSLVYAFVTLMNSNKYIFKFIYFIIMCKQNLKRYTLWPIIFIFSILKVQQTLCFAYRNDFASHQSPSAVLQMPREEQRHNTVSFMMRCYLFFTPESELSVAAGCRKARWKRSQVLRVILLALKRIHQVELRPMMSLRQTRKIKNQIKMKKKKVWAWEINDGPDKLSYWPLLIL